MDSWWPTQLVNFQTLVMMPWFLFGTVWLVTAAFAKTVVRREPLANSLPYRIPLVIGCALLYWQGGGERVPMLGQPVLPSSAAVKLGGLALSLVGVGFAIWARLHLGKMWSGTITLKQDHRLIQSGPYALVRHPIYTGMLLAFVGTAIAIGTVQAVITLPLFVVSFLFKLGLEERLMATTFGAEHAAYRARVKRLIPFVW